MKVIVLIIIKFFLISALFIVSNSNLHLRDASERELFFDYYTGWLDKVFGQVTETVGYVVDSKWLPDNNFSGYLAIFLNRFL